MDVLELPRPVINFLRTMSKEMHRYSLCWDIYGGSESVTLTLTWKLHSSGNSNEAGASGGETTEGDECNAAAANHEPNFHPLTDAYTKRLTNDQLGFTSDSAATTTTSSSGKKRIGCGKLQLAKCGGGGKQQFQHGKLDDLASRNIAQMNVGGSRSGVARNLSAESRLKPNQLIQSNYQQHPKFDNYNYNDYSNDNDDEDYDGSGGKQFHQHQSRRTNVQTYPTNRQVDICPDCPKCNNVNQPSLFDNRINRKQQQTDNLKPTGGNKKVTRLARGKSLESRENAGFVDEFMYPHQTDGEAIGWRSDQPNVYQSKSMNSSNAAYMMANSNEQARGKYENNNESNSATMTIRPDNKCLHQSRSRPTNIATFQNYESMIPITIQQVAKPPDTTSADLESNVSAYFASAGCNYTDLENIPPSQHSGPAASSSSTSTTPNARQQQSVANNNPWIRRSYALPLHQQQTDNFHSINISNNKQPQEPPIDVKKNVKLGGDNNIVCETSLFNRVERENILSIVESSTSSLSRQEANSSNSGSENLRPNPGYFYAQANQTITNSNNPNNNANSSSGNSNNNNGANGNNKVTFDPNLEYI